jgi:hypothetical protein
MHPRYRECWFEKVDFPVWELRSVGTRLRTLIAHLAHVGVGSMLTWRQWLGGKVTSGVSELRLDGILEKRIENCAAYGSGC